MQAIETTANFNEKGELEIDNLPLIKNQKVKLLILLEENEMNEWHQFSRQHLSAAYGKEEPEYTLGMLKEPNPDYEL
jgi:hypothetical protein